MPILCRFCICFTFLCLFSCRLDENKYENDVETYTVTYTIEYENNTDKDINLQQGYFDSAESANKLMNPYYDFTLKNNSTGVLAIIWIYTWHFFAMEPKVSRNDSISSFYLKLSHEYLIAGWPETVYKHDNVISYGHGWGLDASSIAVIHEGELQKFTFDDAGNFKQSIHAKAKLTINSDEEVVFRLTKLPHLAVDCDTHDGI